MFHLRWLRRRLSRRAVPTRSLYNQIGRSSLFYAPMESLESWQQLLADPRKHWRDGYSAKSLASLWFGSEGFPASVRRVLTESTSGSWADLECLFCAPEHKVALPGGSRASQSDLFVLAKAAGRLVVIVVEGKCAEPFGPTVEEWMSDPSEGRRVRLSYLVNLLGLSHEQAVGIRYQLLHRTASALIESKRFSSPSAVVLVHSFANSAQSFNDYSTFASLFGLKAQMNSMVGPTKLDSTELYFGWIEETAGRQTERRS